MPIDFNTIQTFQNQSNKITEPQTAVAPQIITQNQSEQVDKFEKEKTEQNNVEIETPELFSKSPETLKKEDTLQSQNKNEEVEVQTNLKQDKINQQSKIQEKMASTAKVYLATGEYFKAIGKTVIYGGIGATMIMGCDWLFRGWGKVFKKEIKAGDMFNKPLKCVSTKGKVIAGITASIICGFQLAKAYLHANPKTTTIDPKLKTEK